MNFKDKVSHLNDSLNKLYSYKEEFLKLKEEDKDVPPEEWSNSRTHIFLKTFIEPIITNSLQDLKEITLFFCDLEKEIKDTYIKQILSDREDLSDVTDEEVEKFYKVIQDDKLYEIFLDQALPDTLQEFGITKEEYEKEIKQGSDIENGIKDSLDNIFKKAILEPDLTSDEARQIFLKRIVNEMIEEDKKFLSQQEENKISISDRLKNSGPKMNL